MTDAIDYNRRHQALEKRLSGADYRTIAREFGYPTPALAAEAVALALREQESSPERARLQNEMRKAWPWVLKRAEELRRHTAQSRGKSHEKRPPDLSAKGSPPG